MPTEWGWPTTIAYKGIMKIWVRERSAKWFYARSQLTNLNVPQTIVHKIR